MSEQLMKDGGGPTLKVLTGPGQQNVYLTPRMAADWLAAVM